MTLWGSDTIRDVAESVGINALNKEVTSALCRDVEFRMAQVLEQAVKFMRHSKRTVLWSSDISQALRVLDVEPLYGYESTRALKYGEASLGPGQPLFYVEDEEMDFEKLINAPLPKVPREMSFTAHWLALEGVQPTIPQNPTTNEGSSRDLLPKAGPGTSTATSTLTAMADSSTSTTKPLVKHILSKELQLYFEKVTTSILDESQPEYRTAGLASLREDPGLHQLVPYFVQFVAEKVTHNMRDLFILTQMLHLIDALTRNPKLNLNPYVASLIPPVLTCLTGRNLGPPPTTASLTSTTNNNNSTITTTSITSTSTPSTTTTPTSHFPLRDLAASLTKHLTTKFSKTSHNLKPRLARTFLKTFLDPRKTLGSHYGAILGFSAVGGPEVVRALLVPNLSTYDEEILRSAISGSEGDVKKIEAEKVVGAVMKGLRTLVDDSVMVNGHGGGLDEEVKERLVAKIGETVADRFGEDDLDVVRAVLES